MKKKTKELKNISYYLKFPWQFEFETAPEGGYSARVKGLSCYSGGQTLEEARKMIEEALRFHIEGMLEDGVEPQLIDEDACTGKLNIRTSKTMHLKLVQKAKEEDVSVSHLVNDAIIRLYG